MERNDQSRTDQALSVCTGECNEAECQVRRLSSLRPHAKPLTGKAVIFEKVSVKREGTVILDRVSASVPFGGCTALIGPNGAGKTSLLMALLGEMPYDGRIRIMPRYDGRHMRIGLVPQRLQIDRGLPMSVMEFLGMTLQHRPLWLGLKRETCEKGLVVLETVHAGHLASRRIGDLSGGELQRVLLALALLGNPDLLILDEPSAGVDVRGERLFCCLLEELRLQRGFTQLMISHSLGMVARHATHVIALNRTVVAEGTPEEVLTGNHIQELFGIHMEMPQGS
ncbi:MAG: metal ABC transporter ATP-binding protein [Desulfovibrionaceae bacterium]|nr:metal ABC transporter ATP-binding protein [Desulfovibrionaceae bacterium]